MTVVMTAAQRRDLLAATRRAALATVSTAALVAVSSLAAPNAAFAQAAATAAPQAAQAGDLEEIVVTGTRVLRNGYEAPTPLTVVGTEEISNQATAGIGEFVNTLPSFAGSLSPATNQASVSNGQAGIAALNLRNLGTVRTLVLLDGQRSVGSIITGVVDSNALPQQLISRVDVVTGGASAAYGSDALSGVVNFILDKKFTGFKGEVSGGVTTYGDGRNWKVALSSGSEFAGGRGHLLLSGEIVGKDGILTAGGRAWNKTGIAAILNPLYGTPSAACPTCSTSVPQRLVLNNSSVANAAPGGIITSGPLKGIAFGPGGVPFQFNYGSVTGTVDMSGGDWAYTVIRDTKGNSIDDQEARQSVFARASYQITDDIEVFAQASWNGTRTYIYCCPQFNQNNISIKVDNAFLPATVSAQMAANKLTAVTIGSWNADIPVIATNNRRRVQRFVVGANGKLEAFGSDWTWDAYYQNGMSLSSSRIPYATSKARFALALDAVRGANGTIICRSTLTNPTNGCVPYNAMGIGVNSAATLAYMGGSPFIDQDMIQNVAAATLRGNPFESWAGPVSLATGIETRKEKVRGMSDAGSLANDWFVGNYLPTFGSFSVTEGFVETVFPLAKDTVWAKALDLNAAARFTGYSTSGFVTTWKVGATYTPIDDIRFRATRSRDIREPTLADLFNAGLQNTNSVTDPFNNNLLTSYQGNSIGNSVLKPEVADTTGLGFVVTPQFFPGFNVSFDYYKIDISGAISSVSAQQTVDLCYQGNTLFCPLITRGLVNGTNQIIRITTYPLNFVVEAAKGYDIESSYTTPLDAINSSWGGNLTLRFLATHFIEDTSASGIPGSIPSVQVGTVDNPEWRWVGSVNYSLDPIAVGLTMRGRSATKYSNAIVECTSGCPVATANNPTQNINTIAGATYFDVSLSYKFLHEVGNADAFLNVRNVANKAPAQRGPGPSGTPAYSLLSSCGNFDCQGRVFRAGVRWKY